MRNVTQLLKNVTTVLENVTTSTVTSYNLTENGTQSSLGTLESSSNTLSTDSTDTLPSQEDSSIIFDSISFGYGVLVILPIYEANSFLKPICHIPCVYCIAVNFQRAYLGYHKQ